MGVWARWTVDLLLPRQCAACDDALPLGHDGALCEACNASLPMPVTNLCLCCGIPLSPPLRTCAPCSAHPPAFDAARAIGLYLTGPDLLNPLARAVRALKFHGHRAVAASLGAALADLWPIADGAVVVPVPLHPTRLRERGYNQAALLASGLARRAGRRLALRALVRRRATTTQAQLDAAARRANLANAFVAPAPLPDTPVVLVDDVLTTGATADACARALRAAGATHVLVLTVGRTP
jgi:ComF family protein